MAAKKTNIISITKNDTLISQEVFDIAKARFDANGFKVVEDSVEDAELLMTIGGDGATLDALHKYDFPEIPVIGVNTGHLGFFQEIDGSSIDEFIFNYKQGQYTLQPLHTVKAVVSCKDGSQKTIQALNEVVVRGSNFYSIHLNISIGGSFIERYSGDGILVATAAGSTAYNYSLGGSIVDPRLNLLQVTPIAPMNTTSYRSFTSSILLPSELALEVTPDYVRDDLTRIVADGKSSTFSEVGLITLEVSDTIVNLVRLENYDFWNKVKTKFL